MKIVRVDGGICSQINFIAHGLHLQGEDDLVKYDLQWYSDNGKDMDGLQVRNWDMNKAFPGLMTPIATLEEIEKAKKTGRYIGGYPAIGPDLLEQIEVFRTYFRPALSEYDKVILRKIKNESSCAIHVRRGDLSVYNPVYGNPASAHYFIKAIRCIGALQEGVSFYVFSDDMAWVRENIIKVIPEIKIETCDKNGADRGYADLYLMSQCNAIISSGGSLGVFAAALSSNHPRIVVSRYRDWVCSGLPNVMYINDDFGTKIEYGGDQIQLSNYKKDGLYKPLYKIFRHLEKKLGTHYK